MNKTSKAISSVKRKSIKETTIFFFSNIYCFPVRVKYIVTKLIPIIINNNDTVFIIMSPQ